jgi:hypothetical protein
MSDEFLESLAASRLKRLNEDHEVQRKTIGFLSPYSFVSTCSSQSASQEASTFNVVERVPRLLFSFQDKKAKRETKKQTAEAYLTNT